MTRPLTRRGVAASAAAFAAVITITAVAGCSSSASSSSSSASTSSVSQALVPVRIPDPGNSGVLAVGKKDGSLAAALAAAGGKVEWTGTAGPFANPSAATRR